MKKYSDIRRWTTMFAFIALIIPQCLVAQTKHPYDSSYYTVYPHSLTTRIFFSRKYASIILPSVDDKATDVKYKPNEKLNLGLGFTYNNFSLNAGAGLGFLNPKDPGKGETKSFDLQLRLYPYKWAIDALAIFHKGHYLDPEGYAATDANTYYVRPDIKLGLAGISAYHVPNAAKFSYHAAMIQNEWQKKSAGSMLIGGEAYYGSVKGDSALVPSRLNESFQQAGVDKLSFISVGPGVGYAYTWVVAKHFFFMGSAVANVDLNYTTENYANSSANKFSVTFVPVFKTALGFNSNKWDISMNWAGNVAWIGSAVADESYFFQTGNYRLIFARRFNLKKHS